MVDLDLVKLNSRIEHNEDDALILHLIAAASRYVEKFSMVPNDENAPEDQDQAILLLVGHNYKMREAVADRQQVKVPYGFDMFLQALRPGGSLI